MHFFFSSGASFGFFCCSGVTVFLASILLRNRSFVVLLRPALFFLLFDLSFFCEAASSRIRIVLLFVAVRYLLF